MIRAATLEDQQLASWCVATGFPPDVFYSLTLRQQHEFLNAVIRKNRPRK